MTLGLDFRQIRRFDQLVTVANDKQLYEMAVYCIDKLRERKERRPLDLVVER